MTIHLYPYRLYYSHLFCKSTAMIAFKNWTFVTFKQWFSYNHTWPCQVVAYEKQKTTEYVKFLVSEVVVILWEILSSGHLQESL